MAIKKTKIKRALKCNLNILVLPALPVTAVIYIWDNIIAKNKIQALFEIPYRKRIKKNSEELSKNVIIRGVMEDIYYEGSNFWRNHASFKNT